MKIVFVSTECPPSPRAYGIGTYVMESARAMVRLGCEATIIASADGPNGEGELIVDGVRIVRIEAELEERRLPSRVLLGPSAAAVRYRARVAEVLEGLISRGMADIVEFPGFRGESHVWVNEYARRIPMVVRLHGYTGWVDRSWKDYLSRTRRHLKAWESEELLEADHVTSVAHHLVPQLLKRLQPTKVSVIHNGISSEWWFDSSATVSAEVGPNDIVFVGSLARLKGIEVLLDSTLRLRKDHGWSGQLVLAGRRTKEFNAKMRRMMRNDPESMRWVRTLGHCTKTQLRGMYSCAGVCCLPSLKEPFAYTTLEALAAGAVVVGTRSTGMAEQIDEVFGYLVEPGDPAALAEALRSALTLTEDERRRRVVAGRESVRNRFHSDRIATQAKVTYERIIREWARPSVLPAQGTTLGGD